MSNDTHNHDLRFLAPAEHANELGRLGDYRILRIIGVGGMGIVFEAEDIQLARRVALKVLKPVLAVQEDARQRFLREARAMAAIGHEHVITIHHVGEENGTPYLVMELLDGETLQDRLAGQSSLSVAETISIGHQIALGLAAAHERGLIHRDVKPGNIWLAKENKVKVLDFGLARGLAEEEAVTQTGVVVGTPSYMAPEQARAEEVNHRCDLFSLGAVMYRMTTGQAPFRGKDVVSVLRSLENDRPAAPVKINHDIPEALSNLILKLLEKDPKDRPVSATYVASNLKMLEDPGSRRQKIATVSWHENDANGSADNKTTGPRQETPVPTPTQPPRRRRRSRIAWLVRTFFLCLLVLAILALPAIPLVLPLLRSNRSDGRPRLTVGIAGLPNEKLLRVVLVHRHEKRREIAKRDLVPVSYTSGNKSMQFSCMFDALLGEQFVEVVFKDNEGERRILNFRLNKQPQLKNDVPYVIHVEKGMLIQAQYLADHVFKKWAKTRPVFKYKTTGRPSRIYSVRFPIMDRDSNVLRELHGLEDLDIASHYFSNKGIGAIRGLKRLKKLNLSGSAITDDALKTVAALPSLKELALHSVHITDAGLTHLASLKNLRKLDLRRTDVTPDGVKKLRESLKQCDVKSDADVKWISLFNGKDLKEWSKFPQKDVDKYFRVENGNLLLTGKRNGYLYSFKEFRHFVFSCEFRVVKPGRCFVFFGLSPPDKPPPRWYQRVGCDDQNAGLLYSTFFTHEKKLNHDLTAQIKALKPLGQWNSLQFYRRDYMFSHLNGVIVSHGHRAASSGPIGIAGYGAQVEFKNIRVKPIRDEGK